MNLQKEILDKAEEIKQEIIDIRRRIHAYPEIGLEEYVTAKFISDKLKELGLQVKTGVGHTGVVGLLMGKNPGKTILLRADMDCLKLEEKNEVSFKSTRPGLMHACGHDGHVAWLLGAAIILTELKKHINGNIKFVFQPSEENATGAAEMIKDGVLENPKVDYALGAHVWPTLPSGKIGMKKGAIMAATAFFKIIIHGKGAHAASPHISIDPISLGVQIYTGLQLIVSRRLDPLEAAVLTIGKFEAGTANNIIPDNAILEGTVRSLAPYLSEKINAMMEEVIKGICDANGAMYEFIYDEYHPVLVNDPKVIDALMEATVELLGEESLVRLDKGSMAGEDFSAFLQTTKGAYIWIGNENADLGTDKPLHSSNFNIDEDILPIAAAALAYMSIALLNKINL